MRHMAGRLLAVVPFILISLSPAMAQAQKRIALLIGNKDYAAGVGALKNPHNDVAKLSTALAKVGFEVLPLLKNATREQILLAVHDYAEKLKSAGDDAIGFLYYSGHGAASGGQNYLIPVNASEPSTRVLSVQGITHAEILNKLEEVAPQAAHYLVLDACRNNLGGWRGARGFVPEQRRAGVLIAFAAAPGATASDDGQHGSPYATALAAELVKPGQSDLIMFHNVRVAVDRSTRGDQVPWIEDGIRRRDRILFGGAPSRAREAERAWQFVKNSTDPTVLEAFIKEFANSTQAATAQTRLQELKRERAATAALTQFDGSWQVHRVGPSCSWGRDVYFAVNVTKGSIKGWSAGGQVIVGTISASGEIEFNHGTTDSNNKPDGRSAHYSGSLQGNSGAGSFEIGLGQCRGTFTAVRS
jgi:uncharacterized caspase-like protein